MAWFATSTDSDDDTSKFSSEPSLTIHFALGEELPSACRTEVTWVCTETNRPSLQMVSFPGMSKGDKRRGGCEKGKKKKQDDNAKVDVSVTEDRPHWRDVPIEKEWLGDDAAPTAGAQKSRIIHNPPGKLQRNKHSAAR